MMGQALVTMKTIELLLGGASPSPGTKPPS